MADDSTSLTTKFEQEVETTPDGFEVRVGDKVVAGMPVSNPRRSVNDLEFVPVRVTAIHRMGALTVEGLNEQAEIEERSVFIGDIHNPETTQITSNVMPPALPRRGMRAGCDVA